MKLPLVNLLKGCTELGADSILTIPPTINRTKPIHIKMNLPNIFPPFLIVSIFYLNYSKNFILVKSFISDKI
jgi:hypothetical protein